MNVGFVSLGCSKNLIDTEITIGLFKEHHYNIVNDPKEADIIVINTCGFIDSAKEEAINTILEMAEYKKINSNTNGKCRYLIVMGCLVGRYYDDLKKCLPEVDLFLRLDEYDKLWENIENLIEKGTNQSICDKDKNSKEKLQVLPMLRQDEYMERVITTGENYAYLKIGEGCSNRCTYCAIPYIRGAFISRKIEDILEEAKMLAKRGIKEIIVICQDTTKYGIDLYGEPKLVELLDRLSKIKGIEWIRFLYAYPEGITEDLIDLVATNPKLAKYFDIPIQHIADTILKKMNRKTSKKNIEGLIKKIRNKIPDVVLRTSLIVGFPGETKEEFEQLMDFVKIAKFDKLGAFMYSKEEGTPAARLPNQIHGNTKKSRYNKLMELQNHISKENLEKRIGKKGMVLVEKLTFDRKYYIGRTMQDVPDIDGVVYIKNDMETDLLNSFVECEFISLNGEYDFIAKVQNL